LREKVGACRHFNEAFVVIMREFFRLPARLENGYLFSLNKRNSHRWAGVFYNGGWHRFDATGSPPEIAIRGRNVQEEYAAMEATPANFYQLQEKIRLYTQNNIRMDAEEYEARKALFRIANALGPAFLSSAISPTWRAINQRHNLTGDDAIDEAWEYIHLTVTTEHWRHINYFYYYAPDSPEGVQALRDRAHNIIISSGTNSSTRAAYMIAFHIFDNVDEYYAQRHLTVGDYIRVRFAQALVEDRPLTDLASVREVSTYVSQGNNLLALVRYRAFQTAAAPRIEDRSLTDYHMEFLYEALTQSGTIDTAFSRLANLQPNNAPFPGQALSLLAYIAYRTQNQAYRERVTDLFALYHRSSEQQINFIEEYNAPWGLDSISPNRELLALIARSSDMQVLISNLSSRSLDSVLRQIFEANSDYIFAALTIEAAQTAIMLDNLILQTFQSSLILARFDPRFLSLARQIAPQVLESLQARSSVNFYEIDLSILPDLRYLDEDGTGESILYEVLSRIEFSNLSEQESFLRALSERGERPTDFHFTLQGMRNHFSLRVALGASLDGLLLAQGTTPQEIATNILLVPLPEEVNFWLERYPEFFPDLIHHLLLINFTAELQGIPRDTSAIINHVFDLSNFEWNSFLPNLLYPDLLSEEPLPPNTLSLYLQTLDRALQGVTLTEEDFRQIGNIVARNSDNPGAIILLTHLARNPEIDFEMPSFARLTPNFLSAASGLSGNEQALIASFLLAEGADVNASLSTSVAAQDRLLQMVEENLQTGSNEDWAMLSRNLSRFRNEAVREEFLLRQIGLDRPGRNAAEISTLADMLERIDQLGLRLGVDS
jgi:hypothetical protein